MGKKGRKRGRCMNCQRDGLELVKGLCWTCYGGNGKAEMEGEDPEQIQIDYVRMRGKQLQTMVQITRLVNELYDCCLSKDDALKIKDILKPYMAERVEEVSVGANAPDAANTNAEKAAPAPGERVGANTGAHANANRPKECTRQLCPDPPKPAEKPKLVGANAGDGANANKDKDADSAATGQRPVGANAPDAANTNAEGEREEYWTDADSTQRQQGEVPGFAGDQPEPLCNPKLDADDAPF
jgi:hypothetical protein